MILLNPEFAPACVDFSVAETVVFYSCPAYPPNLIFIPFGKAARTQWLVLPPGARE